MLVQPLKETPPADLMACAERPVGFSADAWAVMPEPVRKKVIEIMTAFRANNDRHDRLVNFLEPGSCT